MKLAAGLSFAVAIILLVTMPIVQARLGLKAFGFGSKWTYGEKALREAISNNPSKPPLVVVPLLFPLDLLFLIFFGLALALCSIAYAEALGVPQSRVALLLILPVAYMVADLSENILYSAMLTCKETIDHLIGVAGWATRIKQVAVAFAILQALAALVMAWRG
jgi:uncharacterized membrane protein YccF (DUF307 family)